MLRLENRRLSMGGTYSRKNRENRNKCVIYDYTMKARKDDSKEEKKGATFIYNGHRQTRKNRV